MGHGYQNSPRNPGSQVEPLVDNALAEHDPDTNSPPAELVFGDARGGRRPVEPLAIEVIRALEPDDIQALSGAVAAPAQRLLQIRYSHHRLAELIALGEDQCHISAITGYSPSYISSLGNDPAFQELIQYYATQREQVFVDALDRLKALGLNSVEEIQRRLADDPAKFTNRELGELAELALVKPGQGRGGATVPGPGINIAVSFVGAGQGPGQEPLDVTPRGAR